MTRAAAALPATPSNLCRSLATADQVELLDRVRDQLPMLPVDDIRALLNSLRRYGQLTPILRQGGQIVDGRRRLDALNELGREPWIVDLPSPASPATPADQVLARTFFETNACRRELSLVVRAAIADTLATMHRGANQHGSPGGLSREQAARAFGISADTLDRYRTIKANVALRTKVLEGEVSLAQAVRQVRSEARRDRAQVDPRTGTVAASGPDAPVDEGRRYDVLYADPPWDRDASSVATDGANLEAPQPALSAKAIQAVPVAAVAAADAVLWLRTPNDRIAEALDVLKAWGFGFVTTAVWVSPGGQATGGTVAGAVAAAHQTVLIGQRGQGVPFTGAAVPSAFVGHRLDLTPSGKSTRFVEELERLYPHAAKLALFSRPVRSGWSVLGNPLEPAGPAIAGEPKKGAAMPKRKPASKASGRAKGRRTAHRAPARQGAVEADIGRRWCGQAA